MPWDVSRQAVEAYKVARREDPPVAAAMDRLWARLDLDPEGEGTPIQEAQASADRQLKRVVEAISRLRTNNKTQARLDPRVGYEPVEGPAMPPPWLAWSLHLPNWPEDGTHTLVALGTVSRHGNARL